MEFKLNKIIKICVYLMITLVTLNMINAVEIVPGFQYGGDMISYQNNLYVTDSGNNQIVIFNLNTGKLITTLAVGSKPKDLLLDSNNLYVAVSGSSKIVKIDTNSNSIIETYNLNFQPMSVSKKSNYLYIVEKSINGMAGYPHIYDLNLKSEIGTLPIEQGNSQINRPDFIQIIGNNLYFTETGLSSSKVLIYDITNPLGTLVKTSPDYKFVYTENFKVDSNNNLYVSGGSDFKITDSNFNVLNSLNLVQNPFGIGAGNLYVQKNKNNDVLINEYNSNMQKINSYNLNKYLDQIPSNGILATAQNIYVIGGGYYYPNKLFKIDKNTKQIIDLTNDNHIDLKVLDVNISKQKNNANIEYFNLNFKIKNVGSTPINLNNLNINGTFISSPYHPVNVINSNGNFLQPNLSINVETYLDILPQTTIMAKVKFEVYPKNPFFDINLNDNKAEINYNFTKTQIINSLTQNNQNGQNRQSTTQPNVIIDNSVNTVIVDKSVTNIGAVNVDNSVNTVNIQNSTINVATNANSMVNSKANFNKNQYNTKNNNPNTNNDLKNENSGKNIKNENNNIQIEDVNNSNKLKNSCKKDGINYDLGLRLYSAQNPTYCDVDNLFKSQKDIGSVCQNNFECGTNTCSSGVCTDINAKLDKQTNLLQEILDWLKSFFGGRK